MELGGFLWICIFVLFTINEGRQLNIASIWLADIFILELAAESSHRVVTIIRMVEKKLSVSIPLNTKYTKRKKMLVNGSLYK